MQAICPVLIILSFLPPLAVDTLPVLRISADSYSHYENGTRDIPTNILIAIADFYNISIDYLLERTDCKHIFSINQTGDGLFRTFTQIKEIFYKFYFFL